MSEQHRELRTGGPYSLIDKPLSLRGGRNVYVVFQGFKSAQDAQTWKSSDSPLAEVILDPYPFDERQTKSECKPKF